MKLAIIISSLFVFGMFTKLIVNENTTTDTTKFPPITTPSVPGIVKQTPKPTTQAVIEPTPDPDPYVDCTYQNIAPVKLRSSECAASTDCQIGNLWYWYGSVDECRKDQELYNIQLQADRNRIYDRDRFNSNTSINQNTYTDTGISDIVREAQEYKPGYIAPQNPNININTNVSGTTNTTDCIEADGQYIGNFVQGGDVNICP